MKKILVVEDDKFLANAYRIKLTKSGFDVKIANDGVEAMNMVRQFMPNIILLDLIMPKKDGFTTLKELKSEESLKHIPVVITSNLGQQEDIDKGKKLGASDFIVKSDITLSKLIEKINAFA